MNIKTTLLDLDKHAAEFNFPVLDNAYVQMAAARMSAYRSDCDWLIAFEVLGYSINEVAYVNDLYAFGSCLQREGIQDSTVVLTPNPEQPLIDSLTEAWIADWADWSIAAGGSVYEFTPTRREYSAAGIKVPELSGPGTLAEAQLMRFFINEKGATHLFMTEAALREAFPRCDGLHLFIQTEEWEHPDVAGQEKPSTNPCLVSLVTALGEDAPNMFNSGRANTNWRLWDHSMNDD